VPTPVKRGIFPAHMQVGLVNDGPVTFIIERRAEKKEEV
jgi:D-Tyr-tRNAtyr deacylase